MPQAWRACGRRPAAAFQHGDHRAGETAGRWHDSRSATRYTASGDMVLLEDQDRSRWERDEISEGVRLLDRALRFGMPGQCQLQASVKRVHELGGKTDEVQTVPDASRIVHCQDDQSTPFSMFEPARQG